MDLSKVRRERYLINNKTDRGESDDREFDNNRLLENVVNLFHIHDPPTTHTCQPGYPFYP